MVYVINDGHITLAWSDESWTSESEFRTLCKLFELQFMAGDE